MSTAATREAASSEELDAWLPEPAVRTCQARSARTDADELWRAAEEVRVSETGLLGRLVHWRIPGTPAEMRFTELFERYPFVVLERGPRHAVSGLCGRIWTLRRDYPRLAEADAFRSWREPGTVRVLLAHWSEPDGDGGSRLVSEARVEPVDRRAALRLRALWTVVGRFEPLIRSEALALAVRRAEAGP